MICLRGARRQTTTRTSKREKSKRRVDIDADGDGEYVDVLTIECVRSRGAVDVE